MDGERTFLFLRCEEYSLRRWLVELHFHLGFILCVTDNQGLSGIVSCNTPAEALTRIMCHVSCVGLFESQQLTGATSTGGANNIPLPVQDRASLKSQVVPRGCW